MTAAPATHLVFAAAGRPVSDAWAGDAVGSCRLCGESGAGRPWDAWVRDTFTDHDLLRPGGVVCTACLFCSQERTQMWLAERLGKPKGQRMRNYSHIVLAGVWHALNKGQKREMRDLLMQDPEVAVIADSGQRHLLFRARPGWWQFELAPPIRPDVVRLAWLIGITDALYAAGATKAEIESGHYATASIRRMGIERWRDLEHESGIRNWRGTTMLKLAVFLTQKDESDGDDDAVRDVDEQLALV